MWFCREGITNSNLRQNCWSFLWWELFLEHDITTKFWFRPNTFEVLLWFEGRIGLDKVGCRGISEWSVHSLLLVIFTTSGSEDGFALVQRKYRMVSSFMILVIQKVIVATVVWRCFWGKSIADCWGHSWYVFMVIGIWVSFLIIVVLRKVVVTVVLRCLCCDDKAECWGHSWYLLLWEVFMATVVWRCFLVQMPWRESWVLFVILVILKNIVVMVSLGVVGAFTQKNEWLSIWGISIFGRCGFKVSLVH